MQNERATFKPQHPSILQNEIKLLHENKTTDNIKNSLVKPLPTAPLKFKSSITYIITLICCCFCKNKKVKSIKKLNTKTYTSSILNFFNHLIWILRAINNFRYSTVYRK